MGKKNKITAVSLACLFPLSLLALVLLLPSVAIADTSTYDSPHKNTEGMECDHCHLLMLGTPFVGSPISVDDTTDNQLCLTCHNGLVAKFVSTHSSVAGGQNQWPEAYPSRWTTACSDCHWGSGDSHGLHNQKNVTGSKLVEGTVTGATYDALRT